LNHRTLSLYLRDWPISLRITMTAFLAMVGTGYLFALAQTYETHRNADGREGFTYNDLKAVYAGVTVKIDEKTQLPSRMLEMIRGAMREHLPTEDEFASLEAWLLEGAPEEGFIRAYPPAELSPEVIIQDNCLRCHVPDGESGQEKAHRSPFAEDLFAEANYVMVSKFTNSKVESVSGERHIPPVSRKHLILITHAHMLSVPIFTLITSVLVLATRLPRPMKGVVVATPMVALLFDFAGWWLARVLPGSVWLIALTGPVYGLFLGLQIFAVFLAMWFGRRGEPTDQ